MSELLWDTTFRARLLRQGLSSDEIAQAVQVAEAAAVERDKYRAALNRIAWIHPLYGKVQSVAEARQIAARAVGATE